MDEQISGILQHEAQHAAFTKAIATLKERIPSEECVHGMEMALLAIVLEHRLQSWAAGHINVADRKLGEYLAGRV